MKRKTLYVVLAVAGALALVLAGLGGIAVVSAQEETPGCEDGLSHGIWGWGRPLFGFGRGGDWTMFDTIADELGIAPEQLFEELHDDGKSLEEIAEDREIDLDAIREALNAARDEAMRETIEKAVVEGDMSQERAEWLLEGLEKGYTSEPGFGGGLGRPSHGPGMRGGFDRRGPKSGSSDTRGGLGSFGRQS
ncbi:MAG: hypothetical protein KGY78_00650 [Anaerolineae bacterium]|nr:hypothetical protein [Anaerolineae bacterium]